MMKRTVRIFVSLILLVLLLSSFVSCGKRLSGTYRYDIDASAYMTIYFSGNKYTITYYEDNALVSAFSGKYKIEGSQIEMSREFDEETDTETLSYSVNAEERTITIGTRTYYLVGNS